MEGNSVFVPDDIILNILTRLQVKTLIRLQCVSQAWKNLIKTPFFITQHLHHSANHKPSLLLRLSQWKPRFPQFHLCHLHTNFQLTNLNNAPTHDSSFSYTIVGSSNGLLCFHLSVNNLLRARLLALMLVWNPATREERDIISGTTDFVGTSYFGFGFAPIGNDYKIVRILGFIDVYGGPDIVTGQDAAKSVNGAEVYSLRTGSWKKLEIGNLENVHFYPEHAVTIDGAMFWLGCKKDVGGGGYSHVVVSFDIDLEVFTLIAMPDLTSSLTYKLTLFEDKLALLSSRGTYESCSVILWDIEEDTSAHGKSWRLSQKHISHPYPYTLLPLTIWNNQIVSEVHATPERIREILKEVEDNLTNFVLGETECQLGDRSVHFALCLVNLTTNQSKMFVINKWTFLRVCNYVESLVPIPKAVSLLLQTSE